MISIFAGVRGYLDKIAIADIGRFEQQLLSDIKSKASGILDAISAEKALSDETEGKLKEFMDSFVKTFA